MIQISYPCETLLWHRHEHMHFFVISKTLNMLVTMALCQSRKVVTDGTNASLGHDQ